MEHISVSEGVQNSWGLLKRYAGVLFPAYIIYGVVWLVGDGLPRFLLSGKAGQVSWELSLLLSIVLVITALVSAALGVGFIQMYLHMVDNKTAHLKDLIVPVSLVWKYIMASFVYGLIVMVGYMLLIVPGIIWSIKFSQYMYILVDKRVGPVESLRMSSRLTQGRKWNLVIIGLGLMCINLLGMLALGIGLLITIPLTYITSIWVYRRLEQSAQV